MISGALQSVIYNYHIFLVAKFSIKWEPIYFSLSVNEIVIWMIYRNLQSVDYAYHKNSCGKIYWRTRAYDFFFLSRFLCLWHLHGISWQSRHTVYLCLSKECAAHFRFWVFPTAIKERTMRNNEEVIQLKGNPASQDSTFIFGYNWNTALSW